MTCSTTGKSVSQNAESRRWRDGDSTPTEPLIDSCFDSWRCCKNKKAHGIMGFDDISGGVDVRLIVVRQSSVESIK